MKYCSNCVNQVDVSVAFCTNCGNAVDQQPVAAQPQPQPQPQWQAPSNNEEKKGLATCALVLAFLMPFVGLVLGIVGAIKYKTSKLKTQCIIAIPVSIVAWILWAMIMM